MGRNHSVAPNHQNTAISLTVHPDNPTISSEGEKSIWKQGWLDKGAGWTRSFGSNKSTSRLGQFHNSTPVLLLFNLNFKF